MRHRKGGGKLGRNPSHRRALLRNMVTSLLKYEQIETTDAKAKALRPVAEKMITLAKRGDLHARRQALAYIKEKAVTHRLFGELKDRYLDRQGGYVRIVKKDARKGDGSPISVIQLLPLDEEKKSGKKKARRQRSTKTANTKPREMGEVRKEVEEAGERSDKTPSDVAADVDIGKEEEKEASTEDNTDLEKKENE